MSKRYLEIDEQVTVKAVPLFETILDTFTNQFRDKPKDHLEKSLKNISTETNTPVQEYNGAIRKTKSSETQESEKNQALRFIEMEIPPMEFPRVKKLNREIALSFKYISQVFPVLPCEIEKARWNLRFLPRSSKPTLVLELENTLCQLDTRPDPISGEPALQSIRPHAKKFLECLSNSFEIVLFSSLSRSSIQHCIKKLDRTGNLCSIVLDSSFCFHRAPYFPLKEIQILPCRPVKNVVIVASTLQSFYSNPESCVYVPSFRGELDSDSELPPVMNFLELIPKLPDFRPIVSRFSGIPRLHYLWEKSNNSDNRVESICSSIDLE